MSSSISKSLKEEVWRKSYGDEIDVKCTICLRNQISVFNFECGHIKSKHHGGETELSNLEAICSNCNKSMGTKHMNHFRTDLWRGRKYPNNTKRFEMNEKNNKSNITYISENPTVVSTFVPSIINIDNITNITDMYLKFDVFIKPRANMSDVAPWYDNYLHICENIMKFPKSIKTMNIMQCIDKFSQCKSWYDTASCYERGKLSDLQVKIRSEIIKII